MKFTADLADKKSAAFRAMSKKIAAKVSAAMKAAGVDLGGVKVFKFSAGSIKALLDFLTKDAKVFLQKLFFKYSYYLLWCFFCIKCDVS